MTNIPMRMERVAAAFDEAAKFRSCDSSSGSEHSADLFDLVNSFLERSEIRERINYNIEGADYKDIDDEDVDQPEIDSIELKVHNSLKNLFDRGNDVVRLSILEEVDKALRDVRLSSSSPDFKRRLMARLREKGFDTGLCKSKWEKNGNRLPGEYEYIDVNAGGNRYIIEVFLAGEFTIARPTRFYADSLLEAFPPIFVGKPDELKQVVRLMCNAMNSSMKAAQIHVPPWRRLAYLQAKWFGSYKRTTNEIPSQGIGGELSVNKGVGFAPMQGISFYCRENFAAKGGVRIGNLAAALR